MNRCPWIYQSSGLLPARPLHKTGLPLRPDPSHFSQKQVVWLGLLNYIPFKMCIYAVSLFSLGAEVKYQSRKKEICFYLLKFLFNKSGFPEWRGHIRLLLSPLTVDLSSLSHSSEIPSSFWSLFPFISRSLWIVLHSILLMLVLFY